MNQAVAEATGRETALAFLVAWLYANDERINLDRMSTIANLLTTLPPPAQLEEALHDHFRSAARDAAREVMLMAQGMRRGTP